MEQLVDLVRWTYTSSFENGEGVTVVESVLTGSFAKIKITNLKTFVGDVVKSKGI